MITYPRNTASRYVLFKSSTQEVLNPNTSYPRSDGMEIDGLDPDLVYLEIKEGARPDASGMFYQIEVSKVADVENGDWNVEYSAVQRPEEEITVALENAESSANETLLPYNQQLKMLLLGIGVCLRQLDNAALTNKEQAIKNRIVQKAVKMWRNDEALKAKLQQLAGGNIPDPDAGWETE